MDILRIAILDMLRRKKSAPFSPVGVVQQMYPEDWQHFMDDVLLKMMEIYREGLLEVTEDDRPVDLYAAPNDKMMIRNIRKG